MLTGEKVRFLRLAIGIKQWELAGKMQISPQRISALEISEKISEKQTQRIIKALNLSKKQSEELLKMFTPPNKRKKGKRRGYAILLD